MKTPSVLLLAGALVLAGGAALLARVLLAPPPAPVVASGKPAAPAPAPLTVLVAAHDLRAGQLLERSQLRWQEVTALPSAAQYYQRDRDDLDLSGGAVLRHALPAGQALTAQQLVRAGEPGFLAALLRPGMRAIALPTSAVAVSQGLISAGDRVDVILALKPEPNSAAEPAGTTPRLAAQTLLRDVRVLAINRNTADLTPRRSDKAAAPEKATPYFETVTVEVTPRQAERLALSKEIGTLQLALRGNREPGDGLPRSGSRAVTRLAQATDVFEKPAAAALPVMLYRGDAIEQMRSDQP